MFRKFLATLTLTCVLWMPAAAGEIPTSDAPKPKEQATPSASALGEIPSVPRLDLPGEVLSALLTAFALAL